MDRTRTYESSRNRELSKLAALRTSAEQVGKLSTLPVPAHIEGQLSLFDARPLIDLDGSLWRIVAGDSAEEACSCRRCSSLARSAERTTKRP